MSNVIEFPMDRVRISPTGEDFFLDHAIRVIQQEIDLEEESLRILEQAKAIEEQSQRVLDLMTDLENY
jgi:hypothetical protein